MMIPFVCLFGCFIFVCFVLLFLVGFFFLLFFFFSVVHYVATNIQLSDFISSLVPSAPPDSVQRLRVLTLYSTATLVTWDPVPEISMNGIITQYEV